MDKRAKQGHPAGPGDVARGAIKILESMRGEPIDEETQDVITDACWTAYANGRASATKKGDEHG